ncbi:MAG: hypothetical protein CVU64_05725 [Deltaproteobacteria bacterium HGW-Deltaproteobacteria-21]|nr:MAG: hypothetical protein CVU64_05725 [Deltaproteobacteria bacterium HGW-Deltaproteobacteria-21]
MLVRKPGHRESIDVEDFIFIENPNPIHPEDTRVNGESAEPELYARGPVVSICSFASKYMEICLMCQLIYGPILMPS